MLQENNNSSIRSTPLMIMIYPQAKDRNNRHNRAQYLLHNLLSYIGVAPWIASSLRVHIWYERDRILVTKIEPVRPQAVPSIAKKWKVRVEVPRDRHLRCRRSGNKLRRMDIELEGGAFPCAWHIYLFFSLFLWHCLFFWVFCFCVRVGLGKKKIEMAIICMELCCIEKFLRWALFHWELINPLLLA